MGLPDVPNAPKKAEGWQDASSILQHIDLSSLVEEYDSAEDVVNYVHEELLYDSEDIDRKQREMEQLNWFKCPECVDEIAEYLEQGAMRGEVDIDPTYDIHFNISEDEARYHDEYDVRKTGHLVVYCEEHADEGDGEYFYYQESWYE